MTPPDRDSTSAPDGRAANEKQPRGKRESAIRETEEREAARRRARDHRRGGEAGHATELGRADPELVRHAFAALAENVRDYAIFLMDREGIIRFWGEGARILKRWTREEAEGAHLRLLYPDGGSEDGTAEEHLMEAVERGEYVGEGCRMRGDGTTFLARVTLTALNDERGSLLGFSKVTIDVTAQRAADAARARQRGHSERSRDQVQRRDLSAEVEVLKEEVAVLRRELELRDRGGDD